MEIEHHTTALDGSGNANLGLKIPFVRYNPIDYR